MAFTNLSTELEELINKCEFENKQYVRAINQEKQLFASLQNEIDLKMGEMESLGNAMGEMDQETKRYDRQIIHNKDNSENLKKTNDVLTEHVHAMKTKLDDIKIRRQEEKNIHNQQLQHFTDVWIRYKEKYENFPLAIQLKKLQTQIQDVGKNKEKTIEETKEMKEAIQHVENSKFWKSMDWKTYIIKLSENRVQTLKLQKEIEEMKEKISALITPQRIEMDMQANDPCEENNVQKMSQMQINGNYGPSKDNNVWDMEICSPKIRYGNNVSDMEICTQTISVPSGGDEDYVEFMQTDQSHDVKRRDTVEATENTSQQFQQQDDVANLPFEHTVFSHNLPVSTQLYQPIQTHAEFQQSRDISNKERKPPLPYVAYNKTGQMDEVCDAEKVDLCLNTSNSQAMQQDANRSFNNHLKDNRQHENRPNVQATNSKPSLTDTSYIKTTCIHNPPRNKMPFKPVQAPKLQAYSPRHTFQMSAPTLSHQTGNGIQKSVNQGTFFRPIQSPNIQPPSLLINRSMQITVPKAQTPKITHSEPLRMQTHAVTTTAVKPVPNIQRVNKVGNFGQDQLQTMQFVPTNHSQMELKNQEIIQTRIRVSDKPAEKLSRPDMLKVKNTEVVKPFTPQPSPQPPVSVQHTEISNQKPTTNETEANLTPTKPIDKKCKTPIQQNVTEVASPNQNQPGSVYFVALKSSADNSVDAIDQKVTSPHLSPSTADGLQDGKKHSPFSLEKHHHMLQELKKSPGFEQYYSGRRMFQSESNQNHGMFGGGDSSNVHSGAKSPINTAVFGGAKQPAGDNIYTATPLESTAATGQFNLFSFNNSPDVGESGSTFMMFDEKSNDEPKETTTDGFQLTFGGDDTQQAPIGNALSMFDNTDKSDFSFNLQRGITEDSGNTKNVMSLFGDSPAYQDDKAPSSFSFGLNRNNIDDSDQGGNVLSLFEDSTGNPEQKGSANKDFSFTFGEKKADGKDGIFSLFGETQDVEEKPLSFNFS